MNTSLTLSLLLLCVLAAGVQGDGLIVGQTFNYQQNVNYLVKLNSTTGEVCISDF
jgi:hypothetical protein